MDRMRLERASCYFCSCAKRVTYSGTPLGDFIDLFLDSFAFIWRRMAWKTESELFDGEVANERRPDSTGKSKTFLF